MPGKFCLEISNFRTEMFHRIKQFHIKCSNDKKIGAEKLFEIIDKLSIQFIQFVFNEIFGRFPA